MKNQDVLCTCCNQTTCDETPWEMAKIEYHRPKLEKKTDHDIIKWILTDKTSVTG